MSGLCEKGGQLLGLLGDVEIGFDDGAHSACTFCCRGGIVEDSTEAIDRELERIVPAMVARSGYSPTCDHGVPHDVSFASYCHYRERMLELDH